MLDVGGADGVYDVIVVGAGPAGLSTAVYGASEGLSVLVIDAQRLRRPGRRQHAHRELLRLSHRHRGHGALRARVQPGASSSARSAMIPMRVDDARVRARLAGEPLRVAPRRRRASSARAPSSSRPARATSAWPLDNLRDFEGRGVWYWASPIEAKLCAGEEVVLVGGGNSAGPGGGVPVAARRQGLDDGARDGPRRDDVEVPHRPHREHAEHRAAHAHRDRRSWRAATNGLEAVLVDATARRARRSAARSATCSSSWAPTPPPSGCARARSALDAKGFVKTAPGGLDTNVEGVFAIGDVRAGSTKRVGASIGEGANAVAQIHAYLAKVTA